MDKSAKLRVYRCGSFSEIILLAVEVYAAV